MTTDPNNLPAARLVPKDRADQMAVLRAEAADRAKKAGRVAVSVGKGVSLLAICAIGLAALGAGIGARNSRSKALDDLDRSMERIRRLQVDMPKFPKLDSLELQRLTRELTSPAYRSYYDYQLRDQPLELEPEGIHQAGSRR